MEENVESTGGEKNQSPRRRPYYNNRRRPGPRPPAQEGETPNPPQEAQQQAPQPRQAPTPPPIRQQQQRQPRAPQSHQRQFGKISIVVPLFNEEESLKPLAREIKKVLVDYNSNFEVIFVDDGSRDRSLNVLKDLRNEDRRFRFISFQKNFGKAAALQVGFEAATGDVVITMDADLQDDPNEIPNLIKKLEEGYDMVSGWKKVRFDPFIKKSTSRFFNMITRMMSGIKIHDFNCGLKAYRKSVVKSVTVYGELHRYIPVLAHWQGFTVSEVPVQHHPRRYGKTKYGISRFFKGFIDLVTVVFVTRYIKRPMHLFGFLGAIAFLIGFGLNGYLTVEKIMNNAALSNRPMLFLGMLLIIVGIQFFSIGLLGEMMVHNSQSTKEYKIKDKSV